MALDLLNLYNPDRFHDFSVLKCFSGLKYVSYTNFLILFKVCSDSSWSAETTASNVDGYLAAAAASEASEAENKSKKVAYDNVVIEDGNVRLSD